MTVLDSLMATVRVGIGMLGCVELVPCRTKRKAPSAWGGQNHLGIALWIDAHGLHDMQSAIVVVGASTIKPKMQFNWRPF
eukprot:1675222-Amphidinium_carterae.1